MVAWILGRRSLTEVVQIYVLWNAEIVVNQDPTIHDTGQEYRSRSSSRRENTVKGTPLLPWPANCRRDCWPWHAASSTNKEMDYLVISEEQRKKENHTM
jgi:hypothetical protein